MTRWQSIRYDLRWMIALKLLDWCMKVAPDSTAKDALCIGAIACAKHLGAEVLEHA